MNLPNSEPNGEPFTTLVAPNHHRPARWSASSAFRHAGAALIFSNRQEALDAQIESGKTAPGDGAVSATGWVLRDVSRLKKIHGDAWQHDLPEA
ncbi:hypothetical protein EBT31_00255 [bacterium]|nr:hypothetical protein [bacterium]